MTPEIALVQNLEYPELRNAGNTSFVDEDVFLRKEKPNEEWKDCG
jgi:hypothetical protein